MFSRVVLCALALGVLAGCVTSAATRAAPSFIVLSQNRSADGAFWYRTEAGPMPEAECRATLKTVTTRAKVRFATWYDTTMPQLNHYFGHQAVATFGSWLACWADGTDLGAPDS